MFRNGKAICYRVQLYAANNDIFVSQRTYKKKNNFAQLHFRARSMLIPFSTRTRFHHLYDRSITIVGAERF